MKVWIGVAFLCTFAFGLIAGYLIPREPFRTSIRNEWHANRDSSMRQNMQEREANERRRVVNALGLDQDQQDAFEIIALEFQQKTRRTLQEANLATRDKIRAQSDSMNVRMREILDEDQYTKWEEFNKRRMEMFQRQGPGQGSNQGQRNGRTN